jgi:scyllo-inositol 2-dehydrogenase (NADP+)
MTTFTSDNDLRVALIGFGLGAACFHAPLIAVTRGMRLATVVTGDPVRRAQALREHSGVYVAADADWVWRNAADHDLVVISTPNRTHVPLALAALAAGLPVVIDKPFAPTAVEARRVIEAARPRRLWVSAYHNRRWDSEYLTLRGLLERDLLGRVLRFESRLERWRPAPKGGWRERGAPEEAGGLLYDLGSHLIDQALHLFGPVSEVYAELDCRRAGMETDDDVFVALKHRNGVRSHLWTSYVAALRGPRLRVLGDRGAFVKQHADLQEAALRAGMRPDHAGWGEEPAEHWGILSDGAREQSIRSEPGAYQSFYAQVATSLRDCVAPPVDPDDAVAGLEIIEAAQRSARQRSVVSLV